MGGPSSERKISLVTGKGICENINKSKYEVFPILVQKDRSLQFDNNLYLKINNRPAGLSTSQLTPWSGNLWKKNKIDLIFIALHGAYGEDGSLQGFLETLQVPYTGSGVLASALAMNKVFSHQIYFANGIKYPDFIHFKKNDWKENQVEILKQLGEKIGLPAVIKPVDQGSSVGVTIVRTDAELRSNIDKTMRQFPWLMVQKFVNGQEATCGVLEIKGKPVALPPTRIVANAGKFYDFKSKYSSGGSTHVCPADFDPAINTRLQQLAVQAHQALDCSGMSRTDFFVSGDEIFAIETNTIPGMTKTSLLPEAAKAAGIPFGDMLDHIMRAALR